MAGFVRKMDGGGNPRRLQTSRIFLAAPYMPVILGFAPEHLRIFGYNQRKLRFFADRNFFA